MKKWGYKQLRLLISGLILFQALIMCLLSGGSYIFSKAMDSYVEVPAYITDVWEHGSGGRFSTSEYDYTIVYSYDGQDYEYETSDSFRPDEDMTHAWFNPETGNISVDSKESYVEGFWGFGIMAIIGFLASIISFIVITISGKKKLQRMQNSYPYSNPLQGNFTRNVY